MRSTKISSPKLFKLTNLLRTIFLKNKLLNTALLIAILLALNSATQIKPFDYFENLLIKIYVFYQPTENYTKISALKLVLNNNSATESEKEAINNPVKNAGKLLITSSSIKII